MSHSDGIVMFMNMLYEYMTTQDKLDVNDVDEFRQNKIS